MSRDAVALGRPLEQGPGAPPDPEAAATLESMFAALKQGAPVWLPSEFWTKLNAMNLAQMNAHGVANFKRTLARNYFTFLPTLRNSQFRFVLRHVPIAQWPNVLRDMPPFDPAWELTRKQHWEIVIYTRLLWLYAQAHDPRRVLDRLEEPLVGNPYAITLNGRLISQDLANSALEYTSMAQGIPLADDARPTICEVGAGYGRTAHAFLSLHPGCRYVIVDIPPALFVSQRYLTSVFPDRKAFRFRPVLDDAEVADLATSEIAFLLPHQAALIPSKSVDLFVNISSFHEMREDQIAAYFELVDRVTRGHFYSKQWLLSKNRHDKLRIRRGDYPVKAHWRAVFDRRAAVQAEFFESLHAIGARP